MQQIHAIAIQCARSCMEKSGVSHPGSLDTLKSTNQRVDFLSKM